MEFVSGGPQELEIDETHAGPGEVR